MHLGLPGFGDETNFWLGDENLHANTQSPARLRVVLTDGRYRKFSVASEALNFKAVLKQYTGDAGDSLYCVNRASLSTFDADHDVWTGNRAWSFTCDCVQSLSPLQYKWCLRGSWKAQVFCSSISWKHWKGYCYLMRSTYMWLKPNE